MNPKDNLMAILSGRSSAWTPACVHIANSNNLPGFLPETLLSEPLDRLAVSEFVGGDILYEVGGVAPKYPEGFETESCHHGDCRVNIITTPVGQLTEEVVFSRTPSPQYPNRPGNYAVPEPVVTSTHKKFYVEKIPDYEILASYHESVDFVADNDFIQKEKARVGVKGVLVLGGGPSSPLYSLISRYAGIQQFTFDLFDAQSEVEFAMDEMRASACRWYEAAAKTSSDVIRCTEDLDTKLISPELFRKYAVPALREYAHICHSHGKKFVIHMCGHIRDILPEIKSTGADALHCLTAPPTGNTPLAEAGKILSGATAGMIRVDPSILLHSDEAGIDNWVSKTVDELGEWQNVLIIIPCGRASLRNIRRVISQVQKS